MPSVHDVFPEDELSQDAAMLLCAINDLSLLEHPACGTEDWLPEYYPGWVDEFTEWLDGDVRPGGESRENEVLRLMTDILGSHYIDRCATEFTMHEHSTLKSGKGNPARVDRVHQCCLGFSPERRNDGKYAPHLMRAVLDILGADRSRFFQQGQRYARRWGLKNGEGESESESETEGKVKCEEPNENSRESSSESEDTD